MFLCLCDHWANMLRQQKAMSQCGQYLRICWLEIHLMAEGKRTWKYLTPSTIFNVYTYISLSTSLKHRESFYYRFTSSTTYSSACIMFASFLFEDQLPKQIWSFYATSFSDQTIANYSGCFGYYTSLFPLFFLLLFAFFIQTALTLLYSYSSCSSYSQLSLFYSYSDYSQLSSISIIYDFLLLGRPFFFMGLVTCFTSYFFSSFLGGLPLRVNQIFAGCRSACCSYSSIISLTNCRFLRGYQVDCESGQPSHFTKYSGFPCQSRAYPWN